MLAGTFRVTSKSARRFSFDTDGYTDEGEEFVQATVTVTPETDPPFYVPFVFNRDGRYALFFTTGGVDGTEYLADFLLETSYGQRRAVSVRYIVDDMGRGDTV